MSKTKRKVAALIVSAGLFLYCSGENNYHPNFVINRNSPAFGSYSKGNIYIGSQSFLDRLKDVGENDVLVLDERKRSDPNMKIINSGKIINKNDRNDILEVISKYEEKNPTKWDRTIDSMKLEWFLHNLLYILNYATDHSIDVDLNNEDEDYYNNKLLMKLLHL